MDKLRVKGAIDEVVGSAKRHAGNLTGNTGTQARGAIQQVKGKVETAVGKLKDAGRDAKNCACSQHEANVAESNRREVIVAESRNLLQ
jgi:uncharacterized protein YjbJ (UPF0337 family)